MRERGINVVKTKVGDRYVLEQMLTSGATLGGEQSGHIIFLEHNTTGDGLVTALQLAAVMRESGLPLSELRRVMRRYPQVLVNVPVADKARLATSSAITEAIHAAEAELGESGRVLVRPSGTEPLVRVMAEAADGQTAASIVGRLVELVQTELA
jgi:phosphoglucosamine mutase